MIDNEKYWTNEFGMRYWQHKTLPYELMRSYHWVDNIALLSNNLPEGGRLYHCSLKFSELTNETELITKDGTILKFEDFEILQIYERRKKLERLLK